jgi:succinoglycan biosynthesis transport protein ExoP
VSVDGILSIVWSRRALFFAVFLACVGAVVAVTLILPKTYSATATLSLGGEGSVVTLDTGVAEQLSRTYATLAGNPNVAQEVATRLPSPATRAEVIGKMSFVPVERTQLIQITAEESSPEEAEQLANLYATVFVERVNARFDEGRAPTPISITEAAIPPTSATRPDPPLYIGLGALFSLFLALGTVLARERLDPLVRVPSAAESALGEPVLARVPDQSFGLRQGAQQTMEACRLLKASVELVASGSRVIVVTSPGYREAKTAIAASLAVAFAEDGERVALVEADLRRPQLASIITPRIPGRRALGLTNYLVGAAGEHEILRPHGDLAVAVMRAGPLPANPPALLSSERLVRLFEWLRLEFERVIVEAAPTSAGADAVLVAACADGVVYLVHDQQTKESLAQSGLSQLRKANVPILGIVVGGQRHIPGPNFSPSPRESPLPARTWARLDSARRGGRS